MLETPYQRKNPPKIIIKASFSHFPSERWGAVWTHVRASHEDQQPHKHSHTTNSNLATDLMSWLWEEVKVFEENPHET